MRSAEPLRAGVRGLSFPDRRARMGKMRDPLSLSRKSSLGALAGRGKGMLLRAFSAFFSRPTEWRIREIDAPIDTSRTSVFRLSPADGLVPAFKPGQYALLNFPGRGLLASPRPFAIASSPTEGRFIEIAIRDSGDWSGEAVALPPETRAVIRGPFGRFSYLEAPGSGRFVFMAAGIGAAPFLSMIRYMADADRGAKCLFLWGARTRDDLFLADELARAQERLPGFRFVPVLSHDPRWTGEKGRIDREKIERIVPAFFGSAPGDFEWNSASYRLCGPSGFERDLRAAFRANGTGKRAVHSLSFA